MKKIVGLLLALILPLAFLTDWKLKDFSYPRNDDGYYFVLTQELYKNFQTKDLGTAISDLYMHRHWKPILHPALAVPVLALTGGNVIAAIDIYTGFFYLVMLSMVFLYLNRHLKTDCAVMGTLLFAFIPWVFGMSISFNSELAFVTAVIGFFYSTYDDFSFSSTKKCIISAAWLCLMVGLRPVETVLIFAFPLLALVIFSTAKKIISRRDLLVTLLWLLILVCVIVPPYFLFHDEWAGKAVFLIDGLALIYLAVVLKMSSKLRLNRNFQIFSGIFFFYTIFSYAPFGRTLFDWILVANYQYLAISTGNRFGHPVYEFIFFYLTKLGAMPWIFLIISALGFKYLPKKNEFKKLLIFLAGVIFVPLLAGLSSYNGDVRYYYGSWALLLLLLLVYALNPSSPFYKARKTVLLVLTCASFYTILHKTQPLNFSGNFFTEKFGDSFFILQPLKKESLHQAYEQLSRFLDPEKKSVSIYFITKNLPPFEIDLWALRLIAGEHNKFWELYNPSLYNSTSTDDLLKEANSRDYILAGPLEDDWTDSSRPLLVLGQQLMKKCMQPDADLLQNYPFVNRFETQSGSAKKVTFCLFRNSLHPNSSAAQYTY